MKRLVNRKGFVSMSLIYAFFIVFIAIMLALLADYANNRILAHTLNSNIMDHLDTEAANNCSYIINTSILPSRMPISYQIADGIAKEDNITVKCEGYYKIIVKGLDGQSDGSHVGGKSPKVSVIVRLQNAAVLSYSVGNFSSSVNYFNGGKTTSLVKSTSGGNATSTNNGLPGSATYSYDNFVYNQYAEELDTSDYTSTLDIIYLGTVLN